MRSSRMPRASAAFAPFLLSALVACESAPDAANATDANLAPSEARDAAAPSQTDSAAAPEALDASPQSHDAGGPAPVAPVREGGAQTLEAGPEPADASAMANADAAIGTPQGTPTLFWLDIAQGRVMRGDVEGKSSVGIVTRGSATPDGVAVDPRAGFIYWTNMGVPQSDDGFIMRAGLDGSNPVSVVPKAGTFTPKQLQIDLSAGMLYWSDREGMRVMRARVDGSNLQTLVTTASGDAARANAANWAVGIALDVAGGKLYWTQKGPDNGGKGSIRRASIEPKPGEDSAHRSDIEILFEALPEPIDLALDLERRQIYWTDRGDNTISRAPLDLPGGIAPSARKDREVLVRDAGEAIGIALDLARGLLYYTNLEGTVGRAHLDGSSATALFKNQGSLTGITLVDLPK